MNKNRGGTFRRSTVSVSPLDNETKMTTSCKTLFSFFSEEVWTSTWDSCYVEKLVKFINSLYIHIYIYIKIEVQYWSYQTSIYPVQGDDEQLLLGPTGQPGTLRTIPLLLPQDPRQ